MKNTGVIYILTNPSLPEYVKMGDMPDFKLWQAIKTQVLVQAKLSNVANINKHIKLVFASVLIPLIER